MIVRYDNIFSQVCIGKLRIGSTIHGIGNQWNAIMFNNGCSNYFFHMLSGNMHSPIFQYQSVGLF